MIREQSQGRVGSWQRCWRLALLFAALLAFAACDKIPGMSKDESASNEKSKDDDDGDEKRKSDDDGDDEKKKRKKDKKKRDKEAKRDDDADEEEEVAVAEPAPNQDGQDGNGDGGAVAPAPTASFFDEPKPAIDALLAAVGSKPVRALQLVIYPTYVHLQAQDAAKKENVDEYRYRNGAVAPAVPVKLMGDKSPATLEKNLFDLDDVDMTKLPGLVADAQKQLGYEGGEVTHVILQRPLPFKSGVHWRIYVRSPRDSGSVEYDVNGQTTKVFK